MSKLFFSSDHHFGHSRILEYCTGRAKLWSDLNAMHRGLIERHNDTVGDTDCTIFLGDFAMGKRADTVPFAKLLRGRKILVPGNHDNCWDQGRDASGTTPTKLNKHLEDYKEWGGFEAIWQPPIALGKFNPYNVPDNLILSHLPPLECGDNGVEEARFVDKRPAYPPDDSWMLCGHVHEAWRQHGRVINAGVDVWDYTPVSVDTLVQLMKGGLP